LNTKYYVYALDTRDGHITDAVDFSNEHAAKRAYLAANRQWEMKYQHDSLFRFGYAGVSRKRHDIDDEPDTVGIEYTSRRFTKDDFEFAITQTKKYIGTDNPVCAFMRLVLAVPPESKGATYIVQTEGFALDVKLGIAHSGLCSLGVLTDYQRSAFLEEAEVHQYYLDSFDPHFVHVGNNNGLAKKTVGEGIEKCESEKVKKALRFYVDIANKIRDLDNHRDWDVPTEPTPTDDVTATPPVESSTSVNTEPVNDKRDARLYQLWHNEDITREDFCDTIKKEFPNEFLEPNAAGEAVKRYCDRHNKPFPQRKRGRRPSK
jgi:hypothetical protein